jgi:hypothetical protein
MTAFSIDILEVKVHERYSLTRTYRRVLDDARYRPFNMTVDHRRWFEENLPGWLGYGRV